MVKKIIKNTKKWTNSPLFPDYKKDIVKMCILVEVTYRLKATTMFFPTELAKALMKFVWI